MVVTGLEAQGGELLMKELGETKIVNINDREISVTRVEGSSGKEHPRLKAKLVARDELSTLGDFLRKRGLLITFTTGVYDMIHIGHARYLELAKSLGAVLIVGLNSDNSVRELKGPSRPILDEPRRAEMLSFLESVDYINIYPETDGAEVIRLLKPDVYLCVEGSWEGDIGTKAEVQAIAEYGGEVFYSPRQDPSLSTSAIIDKIGMQAGTALLHEFQQLVESKRDQSSK